MSFLRFQADGSLPERFAVAEVAKGFGVAGARCGEGGNRIAVFRALVQIASENEFMEESRVQSPLQCEDRKREQKQQKKAAYRDGNPKS